LYLSPPKTPHSLPKDSKKVYITTVRIFGQTIR